MPINWPALIVFVLLFALITVLGFVAAHWRRGDLDLLHEWGLAGGRFGTVVTWFLLGGDLYTAYTFIAVPALMFGAGRARLFRRALHDHRLPDRVRRLPAAVVGGAPARLHHRRRFRARTARQQMAGLGGRGDRHRRDDALHRVAAGRHSGRHRARSGSGAPGWSGDLPLVIAFVILAAFTYTSGLRAPAAIAIVKDILIWITVIVAIVAIPIALGGYAKIFAAVPPAKLLLPAPQGQSLGLYSAYATLAFGSALALVPLPACGDGRAVAPATAGRSAATPPVCRPIRCCWR